ncbi:hypothetical protein SEA_NAPOLEONB_83 [Arthrobacter phage NapoleonB]|uniref:Uncharacterized protein n=1 Tax=Arthrobacter phage Dynamite TaxID=2867479 RepID=A0AAE8XNA5_9CAUD|nr:hypothetical protein PQB82_gp82 [Arthrobacter phage Dynamite]QFP95051.1 hypothetical protein SEA_NAPOLEONB_83 [Arthrobacter phage NapoleonB]UAW09243.1 hypothetical protein SEA_DYNAMITE_82 [Arthrobacter phage Dynamite]
MISVRFEWDPSRRFNCDEPLPATTEMPFIPAIGMEIEHDITGYNWQVTRVAWIIAEEPEQEHFIVFVV